MSVFARIIRANGLTYGVTLEFGSLELVGRVTVIVGSKDGGFQCQQV